jgi:hypothetical protein
VLLYLDEQIYTHINRYLNISAKETSGLVGNSKFRYFHISRNCVSAAIIEYVSLSLSLSPLHSFLFIFVTILRRKIKEVVGSRLFLLSTEEGGKQSWMRKIVSVA